MVKLNLERHDGFIAALKDYSKKDSEESRVALEEIFGRENSYKAFSGFVPQLIDPSFMARKKAEEQAFKSAIARDPDKQKHFGSIWDQVEGIVQIYKPIYPRLLFLRTLPRSTAACSR